MRQKSLFVRAVGVCFLVGLLAFAAFAQNEKFTEGSLRVTSENGAKNGLCPLKNTQVTADISGFISRVTVTQIFRNPFPDSIEAVYTFPLPNDAAVDDMTIFIGARTIKGKIMERGKAKETYDKAKQEGKTAALLEQQRPNIFTQAVANITPNAEIKVVISYVETLKYKDDVYEFAFPMTVGERYIPLSVDDADAAKISPKSKQRPGHTVSMEINIKAGVSLENIASNTHQIEAQWFAADQAKVILKNEFEIPNRDFVLRYKTAGQKIEDAILTHKQENDGFFTLILQPPDKILPADTMPKEIVFVLDTSGSMDGFPIKKAKEAMKLTFDNLNPNDMFNLITFAGDTKILFENPVPATRENLAAARKFLSDSDSSGGTEMMKAIKAALEPSGSNAHVRIVCFMTDGQVGNEAEIIAEVQKHPNARVFGFGIGDSVNRYLLDEISREGRGDVEYVGLSDDGSAAARRFYERIRNPLLTDISLEFQGIETADVLPKAIPDLFDAQPVAVVGKYAAGGSGKIIMRGKMQGQIFQREIAVNFPEKTDENNVLSTIWARRKIADLTRRDYTGLQKRLMREDLQTAITELGLKYKILTPFTSFVAVDEQIITDGTQTKTVEVPVAAPNNSTENYSLPEDSPNAAVNQTAVQSLPSNANYSGVSATVEVTAVSDVSMDSTDTKISTNITTQYLASLPLKGNSFQLPLSIAGGITQVNETQSQIQQGLVSSNGQRSTSNYFSVDGAGANLGIAADETSLSGNIGNLPTLTASGGTNSLLTFNMTKEVSIKTMSPAREQRVPGAQIYFSSTGGTNAFHGSAFETFGSEKLNANDFFANSRGLERPPSRLNQFGAALNGFIVKDKAWFSGGYEGLRLRQGAFAVSEVPNSFARQNAVAEIRPILNAFPLANGAETANGFAEFAASYANPARHDIFGLRVDAQLTNDWRVGGRYNFADSSASQRGGQNLSLNNRREIQIRSEFFLFGSTYVINSETVANAFVNFSRNRVGQNFSLDDFGGANVSALDLPASLDFLKYNFSGRNSALIAANPIETTVKQFSAGGNADRIFGSHVFSFGAELRRLSPDIEAQPRERNVLFAGVSNSLNAAAARIREISRTVPQSPTLTNFSLFAQDAWRVNSRLNLNLGLRWDADFAPETGRIDLPDSSNAMPDRLSNFAPRASAAFDIFGNAKSIVRGGAGLYFDLGNGAASSVFADSFPFASGNLARNTFFTNAPNAGIKPLLTFADDLKTPRTLHFYAEFEQQFFRNQSIAVTYAGASGRKQFLTRTLYDADPTYNFIRLTDNSGESDYHALQTRFSQRFSTKFSLDFRYTFSKSTDNFSPDSLRENNFVSADSANERGASDFDARHQLSIFGAYEIPSLFAGGWRRAAAKNWTIAAFVSSRSAFPVNVEYARIGDFGAEIFRPDPVGGAQIYLTENNIRRLNPNAFAVPAEARQGSLGRNSLRGFPLFQLDTSLQRHFNLGNEARFYLEIKALNLLNNTNFADVDGSLGSRFSNGEFLPNPYFGRAVTTFGSGNFTPFYLYGGSRTIQLSAKFVF